MIVVTVAAGVVVGVIALVVIATVLRGRAPMLGAIATVRNRVDVSLRDGEAEVRRFRRPWWRAHALRLRAHERARLATSVVALEARFTSLLQRELGQIPEFRQAAHNALQQVERAYEIDARRLVEEPAWVLRLESLARVPSSVALQGEKLARDIEETLLRIARIGLEEHQQQARRMLEERRRLDPAMQALLRRLETMQRELGRLHARSRRLDEQLGRFFAVREALVFDARAHASLLGSLALHMAGLTLAGVAAWVGWNLLSAPVAGVFDAGPGSLPGAMALGLLGGLSMLFGWLAAEGYRVASWRPVLQFERDQIRQALGALGLVGLFFLALLMGWVGFSGDWIVERDRMLELLIVEGDLEAVPRVSALVATLGAALGVAVTLVVALVPVWFLGALEALRLVLGGVIPATLTFVELVLGIVRLLLRGLLMVVFGVVASISWPLRAVR